MGEEPASGGDEVGLASANCFGNGSGVFVDSGRHNVPLMRRILPHLRMDGRKRKGGMCVRAVEVEPENLHDESKPSLSLGGERGLGLKR